MARIPGFDDQTGAYVDCRVARGFPLGGIGSGGLSLQTDGGFGELRANNNWMCPVRGLRGAFHALFVAAGGRTDTVVLRRTCDGDEYIGVRPVRGTTFLGTLPSCTLRFDDDLPVCASLHAFTPHLPHDVRESTLPAAVFRFRVENPGRAAVEAAILFSFENVLGRGGTGHLGVDLGPRQELRDVHQRVVYDSVAGNWQEAVTIDGRPGVRLLTDQRFDARSHRASVTGEYLLLAEPLPGVEITVCDGWDAGARTASVLEDFARDGRVSSHAPGRRGQDGGWRPAAAVAARTALPPGATAELAFVLAWWLPAHVTEPSLWRHRGAGPHDGVRVGHVYERHFSSIDAVATHTLAERERLEAASAEVGTLLARSTLPGWLLRAIRNSIDSTVSNSVVPASGALYTLEGVDWHWPMGGLTGTNDQRLSAHPYTQTFFTELDLRELDEFRRLADARGAVPHGNGNCDLGLGTTDVPYGWPMVIEGFLPAKDWTDLTMSLVLQVGRLWRTTGRGDILERFWPALVRGMEYLHGLAAHGVPEGGTTYDVWDFPGMFAYSATLYLATLRTMQALAVAVEPSRVARYAARYAACARRLDEDLWDARGFFRSSETKATIFTAALAGDCAARWCGLDPGVDPERAASHLPQPPRSLVTAAQAASATGPAWRWSEATVDGMPVEHPMRAGLPAGEEFTYVWQVVSYQACEQLYLGLVEDALETLRLFYDRLWRDGLAWSGGLRGSGESIYMTHPVAWAGLNALTGAALDVPGRTLHLAPRTGGELGPALPCPGFFPGFWAMLDHQPGRATTLDVLRTFGEPIEIERVARTGAAPVDVGPTALAAGTHIELPA